MDHLLQLVAPLPPAAPPVAPAAPPGGGAPVIVPMVPAAPAAPAIPAAPVLPAAPLAPAVAPAGGPPVGGTPGFLNPNSPVTYLSRYLNHAHDPFAGQYASVYAHYSVPAVNALTPAELRAKIYASSASGVPIAHALLVWPYPNGPDDPGTIQGFHRLVRYEAGLAHPTPFDNIGYAFMGDLIDGQAPISIVWHDEYFNRVANVQVPTAAEMDTLIAGDLNAPQFGPFNNGDPNTETVTTRYCMFIPDRIMGLFLGRSWTPREAWVQIRPALIQDGLGADCEEFLIWLRVALTRHTLSGVIEPSPLVRNIPSQPLPPTTEDSVNFRKFVGTILSRDHPELQSNQVAQGSQLVAAGLHSIAEQTALTRQVDEARRASASTKTPESLFGAGVGLHKLLRWAQVPSTAALPPLYTELANAKKGERRRVLEESISSSLEMLGYDHDVPVTPKLANKILELTWGTRMDDNIEQGVNIFAVGWQTPQAIAEIRSRNTYADALYLGTASPSLADTKMIHESSTEVTIPRSVAQLRYSVEQLHALCLSLLGPNHAWTHQYQLYRKYLVDSEMWLETVHPSRPEHRFLLPAMLARTIQIEFNAWLLEQARTDSLVPVPSLTAVFSDIRRKTSNWEPTMPSVSFGMTGLPPPTLQTPPTPATLLRPAGVTLPAPSAPPGIPTPVPQTIQRNMNYDDRFLEFKHMGLGTRAVKDYCRANTIPWLQLPTGNKFCASFHIKGMCNSRCGFAADHVAHTPAENTLALAWCTTNYKVE